MSVSTHLMSVADPARTADQIVNWLSERGVTRIFGIPGGAIGPVFDALVDSGIEIVVCQHEAMAVYLAAGFARATGTVGVVAVTSGPGVLNTVSSVAAAYLDEVPMMILAGDVRTDWQGRGAIQDGSEHGLNVLGVFRSVVRFAATVDRESRIDAVMGEAWSCALSHPRGPVLVRLPVDIASEALPISTGWRGGEPPRLPDPERIQAAADALAGAKRPLILAGVGAKSSGIAELVSRLAYRTRAPIVTDVEGKGLVSERDPLSLGVIGIGAWPSARAYAADEVDVLITIGARLDDATTGGFSLCSGATLIQLDHDPSRIHRSRIADIPIVADLRAAMEMLIDALPAPTVATVLAREQPIRAARLATDPPEIAPGDRDPREAIRRLQASVDPQAVFVSDIGNHLLFASRHLVSEFPTSFCVSVGLGSMGSGIGTAIGLALGYQGARSVVAVCGDGGLLMVGNELATCARYGIPVLIAVLDNRSLGMIDHGMTRTFGRSACSDVPDIDIVGYARALGVDAYTYDGDGDLRDWARQARSKPVLIRMVVDPSVGTLNPREAGFQASGGRS
ncbi:MAG: thiamine pyrophosphate-binding protein [Myxococcota bacterium]